MGKENFSGTTAFFVSKQWKLVSDETIKLQATYQNDLMERDKDFFS